jgi:hypothetical protein
VLWGWKCCCHKRKAWYVYALSCIVVLRILLRRVHTRGLSFFCCALPVWMTLLFNQSVWSCLGVSWTSISFLGENMEVCYTVIHWKILKIGITWAMLLTKGPSSQAENTQSS